MSTTETSLAPVRKSNVMHRWVMYAFVGGSAGCVVALLVLFGAAAGYGTALGFSLSACAVYACTLTALLSQPVGVIGMLIGATVGAVSGGVTHYVHHHLPRPV